MPTKVDGTIVKTSVNILRNILESLEKDIENIIAGSLTYYKSIFKQIAHHDQFL
jgi:hypothetical protein